MPSAGTYGNIAQPSGFRHMDRFGPSESMLAKFLYPFAWRDVTFVFDDFLGGGNQEPTATDFLEALWVAAGTNGTDFLAATTLAGGVARATTNNSAGDEQTLRGAAVWLGDRNCGMEIRFKVDDIDNQQTEMGFTDPLSGYTASVINAIHTPTLASVGATDVALVGIDTGNGTTATQRFITDGSTANMNTTGTDLGTRTPANATYQVVRVQLAQASAAVVSASAYILSDKGVLQERAEHGSALASQIKGDVLIQPWFYYEPLASSAIVIDIDYWALWQDRS